MNRRADPGLRLDLKVAVQHIDPFLHGDEADAAVLSRGRHLETSPLVGDDQMYPAVRLPQTDATLPDAAVFGGVVQRFLQNPEQAQRSVRRQLMCEIAGFEIDGKRMLIRKLPAKQPNADD